MAQFGSTINPALGRADYSGMLQGAGGAAQGIMQGAQGFAQGMQQGVKNYLQKQEEKKQKESARSMIGRILETNPGFANGLGVPKLPDGKYDPKAIDAAVEAVGGPANAIKFGITLEELGNQRKQQQDAQMAAKWASITDERGNPIASIPPEVIREFAPEHRILGTQLKIKQSQGIAELQKTQQETAALMAKASAPPEMTATQRDVEASIQADIAAGRLRPEQVIARRAELYSSKFAGSEMDRNYNSAKSAFVEQNQREPLPSEEWQLRQDAARIAGNRFREGMPMQNQDGSFAGFSSHDSATGQMLLFDPKTKKLMPMPENAEPATQSAFTREAISNAEFMKLRAKVTQDELSLGRYSKYMESVESANVGINRLADRFTSGFKTFFSSGKLSKQEVARAIAEGKLQGLLGASRIDVVGGGVMTEQDALRVIAYLGGDVDSFTNPEVVRRAIADIYNEKWRTYQDALKMHNSAVKSYWGRLGHEEAAPIKFDPRFVGDSFSLFGETDLMKQRQALQEQLNALKSGKK